MSVNYSMVENHWKKALSNPHRLWIDESKLQVSPAVVFSSGLLPLPCVCIWQ